MFEVRAFLRHLPEFFGDLSGELQKRGFAVTIVGGAVRDFFLKGDPGTDLDIELSHETIEFNQADWKDLGKFLGTFGKVTYLPYNVLRLDAPPYQMEFSPPRIEHYRENALGHSNFDAEFNFKLPFGKAVVRRDFTINAMGIRFHHQKAELLDPLEGLRHLREKCLHPAGVDFAKDPVRFLRSLRFRLKLGFSPSDLLQRELAEFKLQGLGPGHLWSEMHKSRRPLEFMELLLGEKEHHSDLALPLETRDLQKFPELKEMLGESRSHEAWIVALEWVGISSDGWKDYFKLSSESSRRLAKWATFSKDFQGILPENFQGEFEAVRLRPDFAKLFDWYFTTKQLLQKNPKLPILGMIEDYLPHWIHLYRFEPLKDVRHIDPPLRAKYQVWSLCQRI